MKTLTAMVIGGTLAYFLDPTSGQQRRARVRRGVESMLNMGARGAREVGRPEVAEAIGKVQRVARTEREPESPVILPTASKS
jgi:hypothetical protein